MKLPEDKDLRPFCGLEQFKVCDSGTHRFFVMMVMFFIIISCGYSYIYSQTKINDAEVRLNGYLSETTRLKVDVVYNTISDIGTYESKASELMAIKMTNRIKDEYGSDLPRLLESFRNDNYADRPFVPIVHDVVNSGNDLMPSDICRSAGYLVFVKDKLIHNQLFNDKSLAIDPNDFIIHNYNQFLAIKFMDMITNHRSEIRIIEPIKTVWDKHVIIQNMTYDQIRDIVEDEGLEGVSGYYVVKPSYITKHGDIFGINDYDSNGFISDNFKIAVVPYISLYDYLLEYRKHHLNTIDSLENEARKQADVEMRNIYYNSIGSLIVHLCVIFVILNVSRCLFFRNLLSQEDLKSIESKLTNRV